MRAVRESGIPSPSSGPVRRRVFCRSDLHSSSKLPELPDAAVTAGIRAAAQTSHLGQVAHRLLESQRGELAAR